jgi:hypothetical protein
MIPFILQMLGMGGGTGLGGLFGDGGAAAAKAAMPTAAPTAAASSLEPGAAGDIRLMGGVRTTPTATPGNPPSFLSKVGTALDEGAGTNPQAAALGESGGKAAPMGAMPIPAFRPRQSQRPMASTGQGGALQALLAKIMQAQGGQGTPAATQLQRRIGGY